MDEPVEQVGVDPFPDAFWTVPNLFSLARIPLIAPTLWLLWLGADYRWEVFGLVLVMVGTDVLDGFFARRRGEVTRWGKVLDPVADKLVIDSIAIALVPLKGLPVWVAAVVVGRDVLIVVAGVCLMAQGGIVMASNAWGKVTSIVLTMLLLAYTMDLDVAKVPLVGMGVVMLGISTVSYGIRFFRRLYGA